MTKLLAATALLLAPAMAAAAEPAGPPERVASAVVYGNDPCPKGEGDEVIVCARKPERERYRIPKELRHENEPLAERSWAARTAALEDATRETMPNSCSVVGSYGQTGCFARMIRDWFIARRAGNP
jgi:hypothetical protein